MDIYHEHLPFPIILSLNVVWQVRVEVKEQFRIQNSKVFLERVAVVF